jgi:hypothetical protein
VRQSSLSREEEKKTSLRSERRKTNLAAQCMRW